MCRRIVGPVAKEKIDFLEPSPIGIGFTEPPLIAHIQAVDLDDDGAAFIRRLDVDQEGDLVDGWPGGFFDERLTEVLGGRS